MAYNILVVDDSMVVRAMVSKTIQLSGVEVNAIEEATNGEEALKVLEDEWIDLVLADINMPVMNGVQLVEQMAVRGLLEATPVVIISTDRSVTRMAEMKAKGVRDYLNKPITPETVRDTIESILVRGDAGLRRPVPS